jgi:hypothetical protein
VALDANDVRCRHAEVIAKVQGAQRLSFGDGEGRGVAI